MSERPAILSFGENVTPEEVESIKAQFELGAAWAEAEAALPEYWYIRSLMLSHPYSAPTWEVVAADQRRIITAQGPIPAAALRALAAKLRERAG